MQGANRVPDDVEEIFDRVDENGDRRIDFTEFLGLMLEMDHLQSESALRVQFDAIDRDRDGRVSFEEFRAWLSRPAA